MAAAMRRAAPTGRQLAPRLALGVALAALASRLATPAAPSAFVGTALQEVGSRSSSTVAMRSGSASAFFNNDRIKLQRKERMHKEALFRIAESKPRSERFHKPMNWDKLPPTDDVYARKFSGNADTDAIGGRKRYTLYVLYKYDPSAPGQQAFKESRERFAKFLKFKMSCFNVLGTQTKSPIDGANRIKLEYPMKEYGDKVRQGGSLKAKAIYDTAIMMTWNFAAPPSAISYIKQEIYSDNTVLRHMIIKNTRNFNHIGEDNEGHL
ncbi:unnamed protein product [Prorocentrum cordatum]|uniref:Ribosomal protein S6 n=1 Tax=Prorocentrum cordatum TaxID=2364126 RepID=A0ABN9T850_9DINO|nr:unnamed protein product [Polarella glacialis]